MDQHVIVMYELEENVSSMYTVRRTYGVDDDFHS